MICLQIVLPTTYAASLAGDSSKIGSLTSKRYEATVMFMSRCLLWIALLLSMATFAGRMTGGQIHVVRDLAQATFNPVVGYFESKIQSSPIAPASNLIK
jgi:hypothetical protein